MQICRYQRKTQLKQNNLELNEVVLCSTYVPLNGRIVAKLDGMCSRRFAFLVRLVVAGVLLVAWKTTNTISLLNWLSVGFVVVFVIRSKRMSH